MRNLDCTMCWLSARQTCARMHNLAPCMQACQDYERAEGNRALGIGAILDKNVDTMDNVFYS